MHTSLDGFVCGPDHKLDWVRFDDSLFEFVGTLTDQSDMALYGRATYRIMEDYWPKAADSPNASAHDKQHSTWYKSVSKVVLSRTLDPAEYPGISIVGKNLLEEINAVKQHSGKNILMLGSPSSAHSLMKLGLIDEFWIFVNPILLGQGIPIWNYGDKLVKLSLLESKVFVCGVVGLHYANSG